MSQAASFSRFASIIGLPSSSKGANPPGDSANTSNSNDNDGDWYLPYHGPYEQPKTLVQYTPVHPYSGDPPAVGVGASEDYYEDDDEPLRGRRRSRPISRTNDAFQPALVHPFTGVTTTNPSYGGAAFPMTRPKSGGGTSRPSGPGPSYINLDAGGIGDSPRPPLPIASTSSSSKVLPSVIPPNTNSMDTRRGSLAQLMRSGNNKSTSHVTQTLSTFSFPSKRESAARNLPFGPDNSRYLAGGGLDSAGRPRSKSHATTSPTAMNSMSRAPAVAPPTHAYGETRVMTKLSPSASGPVPHPYSTSYAAAQSAYLPLPSGSQPSPSATQRHPSIPSPASSKPASPATPTPTSTTQLYPTQYYATTTQMPPSSHMPHHPFASVSSSSTAAAPQPFPTSHLQPSSTLSPNLRQRLKSLKASVSTPNLRASLLLSSSSHPSTPHQQPSTPREKSKERGLWGTGLCDAFFLPRPKVRAHPISPPDTPPLDTPVTISNVGHGTIFFCRPLFSFIG